MITPVGSEKTISIDIRLICATNADLGDLVYTEEFREDLFYRINTIEIKVPPLRERRDDITILANYFLKKYTSKYQKGKVIIHDKAYDELLNYHWPGNIRELEHMIEKAVILDESGEIQPKDFNFKTTMQSFPSNYPHTLEEMEKLMILNVVNKHGGNMSSTASELGVTRQTLYNKIKKYNLDDQLARNAD